MNTSDTKAKTKVARPFWWRLPKNQTAKMELWNKIAKENHQRIIEKYA